jgi:hypothetical protein
MPADVTGPGKATVPSCDIWCYRRSRQASNPLANLSTDAGSEDPVAGLAGDVLKGVAHSSAPCDPRGQGTVGLADGVDRCHQTVL